MFTIYADSFDHKSEANYEYKNNSEQTSTQKTSLQL